MTENKRFTIEKEVGLYRIFDNGRLIPILDGQPICDLLNALHEENEQLKKQLKEYHNAFDCSQCRYQNYDWFDDGDEFEVCDKGNNEAQMDNHSCKDWEEL